MTVTATIDRITGAENRLVRDINRASDVLEAVSMSDALQSALDRLQRAASSASARLSSASLLARAILHGCDTEVGLLDNLFEDEPQQLLVGPTMPLNAQEGTVDATETDATNSCDDGCADSTGEATATATGMPEPRTRPKRKRSVA